MPSHHEMPQPLGIFAGEQLIRAHEYLDAFERLANTPEPRPLYPMYFLLAHSIELFLKSYLAARQITKKVLMRRDVRHNLIALLDLCEAHHLPVIADLRIYLASIQEMNGDHDFRYVTNYNLTVPSPAHCIGIVRRLELVISPIVDQARMESTIKHAAATRHLKGQKIRWSD
ncbi:MULTISPECIES: hypothetical protein [unclassified Bradyrhizobium]|jgi:hypothetical protein|uniref:hypothetical protein n=1 Tax=unclassified Bradyrhizobium TaxID=2631580 RepID=UPI00104AF1A7|nr:MULTISPECIES: hypothetical protein [unclassified Bradyrhizobium]TCU75306.1 hypothetical protein EDE10_103525 [Bradyrhizobium sp. Y-H1]